MRLTSAGWERGERGPTDDREQDMCSPASRLLGDTLPIPRMALCWMESTRNVCGRGRVLELEASTEVYTLEPWRFPQIGTRVGSGLKISLQESRSKLVPNIDMAIAIAIARHLKAFLSLEYL